MMPTSHRQLTMGHIADRHRGALQPVTGEALVSSPAAPRPAPLSWCDGLWGHDGRASPEGEACSAGMLKAGKAPLAQAQRRWHARR